MQKTAFSPSVGIDFGTTNSVVATASDHGVVELVPFDTPSGRTDVFRSALCFWEDDGGRTALAHEAGPWAIREFLDYPHGSRFIQSFKSIAANPTFEFANVFERRFRFEELGRIFLGHFLDHAGLSVTDLPDRIIVGRPVRYVGSRADPLLARTRYDAMFAFLGRPVHYVYEPLGAAFSFATRMTEPGLLLVADFGGGTSDISVVRVEAPGVARRCTPLGAAGIGIAGDRFDYRIMDHLVLPLLGKGGTYSSFDKVLDIPAGHFAGFGDWSKLALMRNRTTLAELERLRRAATDPDAIGRMIAVVEHELGHGLYDAVGKLKRTLSDDTHALFRFESDDLAISAEVSRTEFEDWIARDVDRIAATVDEALARAKVGADQIDHVFLTGGSSAIPMVRRLFEHRFGPDKIESGGELTSIAHGLALIGQAPDIQSWSMTEDVPV